MLDQYFARPSFLYALPLLLLLGLAGIVANKARRRRLAIFGRPEASKSLSSLRPNARFRRRLLLFAALVVLIGAVAGPRWGKGGNEGVVVGRDIVLVLDLSRSMIVADIRDAELKQRWQAAKFAAQDMLATIRQRGGHRIGVVVYATHAFTICPLTSDYEHVRSRLDEFTPSAPPREIRAYPNDPEGISGTAMGAGIREAIAVHDARFPGYQDVILFSDGDGPDIEQELEFGIREAAQRQIPVHVIGIGDPKDAHKFEYGEGDEKHEVLSKLQEGILKDVARRTKGEYVPAHDELTPLGNWFTQVLEPRPSRELSDDALPQARGRGAWFLGAGLLLLVLAWVREP